MWDWQPSRILSVDVSRDGKLISYSGADGQVHTRCPWPNLHRGQIVLCGRCTDRNTVLSMIKGSLLMLNYAAMGGCGGKWVAHGTKWERYKANCVRGHSFLLCHMHYILPI